VNLLSNILAKLPGTLAKTVNNTPPQLDFDKFSEASAIKLRMHYDMWKGRIRTASENNTILSNGWAFSTMSGLACFEAYVRYDPNVKHIYFDKSGEIDRTLDRLADVLHKHNHKLSGAIIYGYGNLLRESHFIEQAKNARLLNVERIYLLDCSLFYHLFAKSPINPLRQFISERAIKPILLDYFEGDACKGRLVDIRNELNPLKPVLHLFLGNTFCNVESHSVHQILNNTVRVGDFVVAEYANYTQEFFESTDPDYVNQLATRAAADLFALSESRVDTKCVLVPGGDAKALLISIPDDDTGNILNFHSMLRRKFHPSELTDGAFSRVSTHRVLDGSLNLDAYRRLNNPGG
jgi:hypothetical protein